MTGQRGRGQLCIFSDIALEPGVNLLSQLWELPKQGSWNCFLLESVPWSGIPGGLGIIYVTRLKGPWTYSFCAPYSTEQRAECPARDLVCTDPLNKAFHLDQASFCSLWGWGLQCDSGYRDPSGELLGLPPSLLWCSQVLWLVLNLEELCISSLEVCVWEEELKQKTRRKAVWWETD